MSPQDFRLLKRARSLVSLHPCGEVYFYGDTLSLRWKTGDMQGQLSWKNKVVCAFLRQLHSQHPSSSSTTVLKSSVTLAYELMKKEKENAATIN